MTTERLERPHAAPEVVGGYEVVMPIGSGGMGEVYLARKRVVGDVYRDFALKLIRPTLDARSDWSRLLVDEAKIAARIRHPNVVSVLEVGESAHGVYLVMDYVEGVNLAMLGRAAAQRGREIPLRVVARVLHDALQGLHAVHELRDAAGLPLKVVHRDVSPQNLLVGADGTTRLTDFGIAKAVSRPDTTVTGAIKGKLRYMAPEQARGRPLDRRVDVWAMGVIAWELIAGERLFAGESDAEVLLQVASAGPPMPLYERRLDVPVEVDEAIKTALTAEPVARCPTALELQKRLDAAWPDGIAPVRELAAYVEDLAANELAERRAAQRSSQSRAQSASSATMPSKQSMTERIADGDETDAANVVDATRHARARRTPLVPWALAAGAMLVATGAVLFRFDLRARRFEAARAGLSEAASAVVAAPLASTGEAGATAAPLATRALELRSDVPLKQVSVDDKPIVLGRASRTVVIQVPSGPDASVRIEVVAVDGRRAQKTIRGDASDAAFELGAARAAEPSDRRLLPYRPGQP